jgi:hypothetical protein
LKKQRLAETLCLAGGGWPIWDMLLHTKVLPETIRARHFHSVIFAG